MVLADPVGSILAPLVKTGKMIEAGSWTVEGIGEDFVPPNCDLSLVKNAYAISDKESVEAARELLSKEARILARLNHPNVVRLFDLADSEHGLLMVLEYVCGPDLQRVLKVRGRLSEPEVLHVLKQTCDGLEAAHREQIVHRDLKPGNLLLSLSGAGKEMFQVGVLDRLIRSANSCTVSRPSRCRWDRIPLEY